MQQPLPLQLQWAQPRTQGTPFKRPFKKINFYCKGDRTPAQVARRGCGVSVLADRQNVAGQGPGFERWVWTPSSGLFSPQLFCNWVNFSTGEDVCWFAAFVLPALFHRPLLQPLKDLMSVHRSNPELSAYRSIHSPTAAGE